ncbi:c-type cytochrome [soil metagenome]
MTKCILAESPPLTLPAMKPILLLAFTLSCTLAVAEPPKVSPFPEPYDSEKNAPKPMSAIDAARGFKMPPGFNVEVFASEPDVRNPIAMCWDTKGRMWVAENYTYAESKLKFDLNLRDRVVIFHDKNGDNKPTRKVFCDNVQRLTSVEVGLGGVWLMCPPQLLFIPDANGDDIPDGPPQVILEGFDVPAENYHNFANGLKWGPDGWLYGRCGASAPGKVRRPDEGPDKAIPLAGGIWRYHPTRKVFEPLCHGTTNPWGHDWDANGELFFINTVGGHLWHMIPGAHYSRSHTLDPNPLVYQPMEMIADHWHFETNKGWKDSGKVNDTVDKLGGGHAHIGCLIYNGGQWPEEYRGKLLTLNQHGRRINVESLHRNGSGFVGKHEPDMFFANDPFFRGLELSDGPDGNVYVLDWNDTGECHDHTGVLRSTGRIYRIEYGLRKSTWIAPFQPPGTRQLSDAERVDNAFSLVAGANVWNSRYGSRFLIDRIASGKNIGDVVNAMLRIAHNKVATQNPYYSQMRVQCMQTLYALDQLNTEDLMVLIDDREEHMRVWAIRFLLDANPIDTVSSQQPKRPNVISDALLEKLCSVAIQDRSGLVRLTLASSLQRLPVNLRVKLASVLLARSEDNEDLQIPPLIWSGLIPVARDNPESLIPLAAESRISLVRKWTARRFGEIISTKPDCLNDLLTKTATAEESVRQDIVLGMTQGLAGVRKAKMPAAWTAFNKTFADKAMEAKIRTLDVIFGDGRALDEVKKLAFDNNANLEQRKAAVLSLIDANPPELREMCEKLLKVRFLNTIALKGLVTFDDAGPVIAKSYKAFHPSERGAVIAALSSRPSFAAVLLKEIETGAIPRTEVTASQARQIRSFEKPDLTAKLAAVWGEQRESPKDKQDLIAKLKAELTKEVIAKADLSAGRAVFAKTCMSCHKLYGSGEAIGPDLTGAGRKDLDYLLSNIVDPSAVVTKDYLMTSFNLADGRTLNGIVKAETPTTITLQLEKEVLTLPKADIEKRTLSKLSLMPDGQVQAMKPQEIRDLIAYLMSDSQVPLIEMK